MHDDHLKYDDMPDDQLPDDQLKQVLTGLRDEYNAPPETPRDEMWSAIQARLGSEGGKEAFPSETELPETGVGRSEGARPISESGQAVSLDAHRRARFGRARFAGFRKPLQWSAAAAAVLALGLGIGRMTAPAVGPAPSKGAGGGSSVEVAQSEAGPAEGSPRAVNSPRAENSPHAANSPRAVGSPDGSVLRVAALEHLVRTESLLTLVRADARAGGVEPAVGSWARSLLSQTRLLMDAQRGGDPAMEDLLEDLELVLVQIVGVSNASEGDQERVRSELNLALDGMNEREVLSRMQAVIPVGLRFVGS